MRPLRPGLSPDGLEDSPEIGPGPNNGFGYFSGLQSFIIIDTRIELWHNTYGLWTHEQTKHTNITNRKIRQRIRQRTQELHFGVGEHQQQALI